jgi:hypothetical protein
LIRRLIHDHLRHGEGHHGLVPLCSGLGSVNDKSSLGRHNEYSDLLHTFEKGLSHRTIGPQDVGQILEEPEAHFHRHVVSGS